MSVVPFDSTTLRRALGCFATGVAVITMRDSDGKRVGMTCNSFTSVSLDPPLVQWSIAKSSRNYGLVAEIGHFAVHILDAAQGALCRQFSSKDQDRFAGVEIETGLHELPLLAQYHARFECEVYARYDAGDHTIVLGKVLRLQEQEGAPLVFYRSALSRLAPFD